MILDEKRTYYLVVEVAEYFSVSVKTVRRWIGCGWLESIQFDRGIRIHKDAITEFEAQRKTLKY